MSFHRSSVSYVADVLVAASVLGICALASGETRPVGAQLPFVTLEAESPANKTNGEVVRLMPLPTQGHRSPEIEASGRAFVSLTAAGDFIEFPIAAAANTIVIRHCTPDSAEGGGAQSSLGLYVNGERRQSLKLSSKHAWLYGPGANGMSNTPAEAAHVFWDETRAFVDRGIQPGDVVRLQKDAEDTASFYRVDLIDLEQVDGPAPIAADELSVRDFGARGDNAAADTKAIQACVDEAKKTGKSVYLPAGKYLTNSVVNLDGVRLRGAGMWHTEILDMSGDSGREWTNAGFKLGGDGASVSDLYIDSVSLTYRAPKGARTFTAISRDNLPRNWKVNRVWVTHANCAFWMSGYDGIIENCRVRMTYADGININNGNELAAENVVVSNNHVRGTGDDGLAILSHEKAPNITKNVILRNNTVVAPWWANAFDLAGGNGHVIEDNVFADGATGSSIAIVLPPSYRMHALTGAIIRRNTLLRGGGNHSGQRRGAIWIYPGSTTVDGTVFSENKIIEPLFRGIHVVGPLSQQVVFDRNVVTTPGQDAIFIDRKAIGRLKFTGNHVEGLREQNRPLVRDEGSIADVVETDNTWNQ